ncbi:MAG: DUF4178 domain-containing protein [Elainellaceae cyanobacterium]
MSLSLLWIVIALAVVGAGVWLWWSSSRPQPRTRETSRNLTRQPSIFDMRIGDIVQYAGRDWVVEGKLVYNDDGFSWLEYMLQDDNDIRWLSVEEDDWVTVSLLNSVNSLDVSTTPPQELTFEGVAYRRVESGTAQMRREGNPRRPDIEQCRYFDYEGPEDRVLSVEDWDGDIEVTAGTVIAPRSLVILPGQGNSVYSPV